MEKKLRIDKFLWHIRLFKTRTLSSKHCELGRVIFKNKSIKPNKIVQEGESYTIKMQHKIIEILVTSILHKRVSAQEAIKYYTVLNEEEKHIPSQSYSFSFFTGKRWSKSGRPTKKDRRNLDNHNINNQGL